MRTTREGEAGTTGKIAKSRTCSVVGVVAGEPLQRQEVQVAIPTLLDFGFPGQLAIWHMPEAQQQGTTDSEGAGVGTSSDDVLEETGREA